MRKILEYALLTFLLALWAPAAASAKQRHREDPPRLRTPTAPEVDPNQAVGGFSLLAGALSVLRARKRK